MTDIQKLINQKLLDLIRELNLHVQDNRYQESNDSMIDKLQNLIDIEEYEHVCIECGDIENSYQQDCCNKYCTDCHYSNDC